MPKRRQTKKNINYDSPKTGERRLGKKKIAERILNELEEKKQLTKKEVFSLFPARYSVAIKEALENLVTDRKMDEISKGKYKPTGELNATEELETLIELAGIEKPVTKRVQKAVDAISGRITQNEIKKRRDLRKTPFVTIDPADARDYDDAIFVQKTKGGGFKLLVAISDVSHYIPANSVIDKRVRKLGTSVYLPHRAIHMLPEKLATEVCSLQPGSDKLALCAEINYTSGGKLKSYKIFEAVINSKMALAYQSVQRFFDTGKSGLGAQVEQSLTHAKALATLLYKKRCERGTLEFHFSEPKVVIKNDRVTAIEISEKYFSCDVIEEFMLAANRCVADYCLKNKLPVIYRIHEEPDEEAVTEVIALATKLTGKPYNADVKSIAALLRDIKGTEHEKRLSQATLRSLMQARYSAKNHGHYALGFDEYLHFTSPIRRYPDLMTHRAIKSHFNSQTVETPPGQLEQLAQNLSDAERTAEDKEREAISLSEALLMNDKKGLALKAVIVTVTDFGCFIEIQNKGFLVHGLLPVSYMPSDYYNFRANEQMLIGENTGNKYRTGDKINVLLHEVNIGRRQLTFKLKL